MTKLYSLLGNDASGVINTLYVEIFSEAQGNSFYNRIISAIFNLVQEIPSQILVCSSSIKHNVLLSYLVTFITNGLEHTVKYVHLRNLVIQSFEDLNKKLEQEITKTRNNFPNKNINNAISHQHRQEIDKKINSSTEQLKALMLKRMNEEMVTPAFTKAINFAFSNIKQYKENNDREEIVRMQMLHQRQLNAIMQEREEKL